MLRRIMFHLLGEGPALGLGRMLQSYGYGFCVAFMAAGLCLTLVLDLPGAPAALSGVIPFVVVGAGVAGLCGMAGASIVAAPAASKGRVGAVIKRVPQSGGPAIAAPGARSLSSPPRKH